MNLTTIFLTGMRFYAYHGCFEEEQKIGTHFIADVTSRMTQRRLWQATTWKNR